MIYNTTVDLVNMMCIQNLVSFCQFVLKKLSKNEILMSIKGRNPVANLQKQRFISPMQILSMIMSIQNFVNSSQDIEQKPNSDMKQGPLPS